MWNKQGVARRAGEIDRDKIRVTLASLLSLALSETEFGRRSRRRNASQPREGGERRFAV